MDEIENKIPKLNLILPMVDTPNGLVSINSETFVINRYEYLRNGLVIKDVKTSLITTHKNMVSDTAKTIMRIAQCMIHIMKAVNGMGDNIDSQTFTVDLIPEVNDFDETYRWNPHVATLKITHVTTDKTLSAKLFAVIVEDIN